MAADVAEEYGDAGYSGLVGGGRSAFAPTPISRSRHRMASLETGGDAPQYKGGGAPASSNAESWMKFAQTTREQGGLGLTREQASGLVGNLQHESGAGIAPSGVTGDRGTAHGAAQWRNERFSALQQKSGEWGMDWRTTEAQQRFMRHEMDNSESGAYAALRAARTPEQSADAFNRTYERSADPGAGRRQAARRLFESQGQQQQAAPTGAPMGAAGNAVDSALQMEGLHERRDRSAIKEYLRTGGAGMDPATTSWCAAFVNSSLQRHGVRGSGSAVANSFQQWGQPVHDGAQRGDVMVLPHGRGPGETGGHVGLATGQTRTDERGRLQYEMVSGNRSDRVLRSWEPANSVMIRRAPAAARPIQTAEQLGPG